MSQMKNNFGKLKSMTYFLKIVFHSIFLENNSNSQQVK